MTRSINRADRAAKDSARRKVCYEKRCASDPTFKEASIQRVRDWRNANPELAKERARVYNAKVVPEKKLLWAAKHRARTKGIPFEIWLEHIAIPKTCPVLGLPLIVGSGKWTDTSPTLDRIDNSKGYVPGNIEVISWRANRLKCDAAIEEIELLYRHMKRNSEAST